MSMMPEKCLNVSPQLAATIGLEEAILYQLLAEIQYLTHQDPQRISIDCRHLASLLPFWSNADIRRLCSSLQDKGVITPLAQAFGATGDFVFSFSSTTTPARKGGPPPQQAPTSPSEPSEPPAQRRTRLMDTSWQPARDVVAQLNQYGIPPAFIEQQIPEFITYWSERGDPMHSWNAKFLKNTLRLWREEQTREVKRGRETQMTSDWKPSRDAVELLTRQGGINRNFIEDAIPEFILYWHEKGDRRSTWNTDFVRHVKLQWARFTATLENDSEPRLIARNWQPSEDLYEVLQLANIPREFARQQVPEFSLYWRESGQITASWNTKFLQHVKRQWARHCATGDNSHEKHQGPGPAVRTRDRSLVEDLTDRSWAN